MSNTFYFKTKKMVEIFKTNVVKIKQSKMLIKQLKNSLPKSKISFDLNDCDKILRVEGVDIESETIIEFLILNGFQCQILK